jgi:dihydroorotate dehydrogenase electron transfer subunit
MTEEIFTLLRNDAIAQDVYKAVLKGNTSQITVPGQFVNIKLDGFFLRRPISVCDVKPPFMGDEGELTLIYKTVGKGTDTMSRMAAGEKMNILTGLGHGFDVSASGKRPLLVGGGVGTPPMYGLAKKLVHAGRSVDVILGFNTADDVFLADEFEALNDLYEFGCEGFEGAKPEVRVYVATVSGETGTKGFVTDCLGKIDECTHYYACGPIPMLKALKAAMAEAFPGIGGELSLEERMGCGFGACVGCSVETASGFKKVCTDGPVFPADEVFVS